MDLKNKRVLITAGPTWIPIDAVRVISNIATGETGILLANFLNRLGAKITLILGSVDACCLNKKIKVIPFKFFDELKNKVLKELKTKRYDILIHTAAVSDYRPTKVYKKKIKSGIKNLKLNLIPTAKIINLIRKTCPDLFLVGFKFEPKVQKDLLFKKTRQLIEEANLDLAVANTINKNRYRAYIINHSRIYGPIFRKKDMAKELIRLIRRHLCKN